MTSFKGLYDGFYDDLLANQTFTSAKISSGDGKVVVRGMIFDNVSMEISINPEKKKGTNANVKFYESDQKGSKLICKK